MTDAQLREARVLLRAKIQATEAEINAKKEAAAQWKIAQDAIMKRLKGAMVPKPKKAQDDAAYVAFARMVFEEGAKGTVQQKDLASLVGMSPQAFGTHVSRVRYGKSPYAGPSPGKKVLLSPEGKKQYVQAVAERKHTRNSVAEENQQSFLRELVEKDLKVRGCAVPWAGKKPEDIKPFSNTWMRGLQQVTGVGLKKCGRDNSARERALSSPRNLISNMAGLVSLIDPEFTHDRKCVHPRLRGNIDALTVYRKQEAGRCVAVCKRTPLVQDNPELKAAVDDAASQPDTVRADSNLNAVNTRA